MFQIAILLMSHQRLIFLAHPPHQIIRRVQSSLFSVSSFNVHLIHLMQVHPMMVKMMVKVGTLSALFLARHGRVNLIVIFCKVEHLVVLFGVVLLGDD